MSKAEKARQIVKEFPHTSKKELGKILHQRNPILFKDAEDARYTIRTVTGAAKGNDRVTQTKAYKGPLSIPRGEINDFSPYVVKGSNVGIICDIHLPYHDFDALEIAIKELKKQKIDTLILNGDIIDCYHASDYEKDPNKRNLPGEIAMLCHFLSDLQKSFPKVKIIYKLGNHEERFERYILKKAPALWGFECFELNNLIKIEYLRLMGKPLDIDFVKGKRIIRIGKLAVIHGHEFREGSFSPVNPARGYFIRSFASVIGGDKHRTSEHTEPDINGKLFGAWSIGCLCDLHPLYMPLNKWNLGFSRVIKYEDESFEVKNQKIIGGKIA